MPQKTSFPPRGQTEPAAPQAATEREPGLRTPDPNAFRDHAPMPDALRLEEHDARMDRGPVPKRSSGARAAGLAALVLMLAVLGLTVFSYYSPGPSEPRTAATPMQEAPAIVAAAPEASPPRAMGDARAEQESLGIASAPNPLPPKPLVAEPSPPARTESLPTRELSNPQQALRPRKRRRGHHNRGRKSRSRSLGAPRGSSSRYRRAASSTLMASTTARHRRSRRSFSSRECIASRFAADRGSRF